MTYVGRVRVSYEYRATRLERLRNMQAAYSEMRDRLGHLEETWNACSQTMDGRRNSCTSVMVAISQFAKHFDLPQFATERLNDLNVGLGELIAGRNSALLQRADMPTRTPSATDDVNQAVAQVCVDLFRGAGVGAGEARARTARLFLSQGFQNFSVSKIKLLGSRLTGMGASMDRAFGEYQMIKGVAATMLAERGTAWPPSESVAHAVARALVAKARRLDHRLAA